MRTPNQDFIELYLTSLRQRSFTEASIATYRMLLSVADDQLQHGLDRSNEEELTAWIWREGKEQARDKAEGLTPATRAAYHKALKGFYAWACRDGEHNPMQRIPRPRVPKCLPRVALTEEVAYVVTSAPQPYKLWGILAAFGSLRCIEISRLEREHVTADALTVHRGKGDKPRVLPTHPLIWASVQSLPPGPITDLDAHDVSSYFINWRTRSGLKLSLHRMRGWFCTQGYLATHDPEAMKQLMGHEDWATTAGYISLPRENLLRPIAGLPTFGADPGAAGRDPS